MRCQLEGVRLHLPERVLRRLIEHEFDHVLFGRSVAPAPNPDEVADTKYVDFATLRADMAAHPDHYTTWFRICFERRRALGQVNLFPSLSAKGAFGIRLGARAGVAGVLGFLHAVGLTGGPLRCQPRPGPDGVQPAALRRRHPRIRPP